MSTTCFVPDPCVNDPMLCPRPNAVSTSRCFHDLLCPLPTVSKTQCIHRMLCSRPLCPRPNAVSTTRCFYGLLCPRPTMSMAWCVHSLRPLYIPCQRHCMRTCMHCIGDGGWGWRRSGICNKCLELIGICHNSPGQILACYMGLPEHRDVILNLTDKPKPSALCNGV